MVVLGGVAVFYERGTPVRWLSLLSRAKGLAIFPAVVKAVRLLFLFWGGEVSLFDAPPRHCQYLHPA